MHKYKVEYLSPHDIVPSPENDEIYGKVDRDEQMEALIDSIRNRGLEEPIIVSADRYIISGHRRYFALLELQRDEIPVRIKPDVARNGNGDWHRILAEYNPQRIKSAGSLLKEALLRHADDDASSLIMDHRAASIQVDAEFTEVPGHKHVRPISDKKREFLLAVQSVVENMRSYWPLSVRQIHYNLLNEPPFISRPKRSKYALEHYRYKNDKRSYDALVALLTPARYHGQIPMNAIDDATRPRFEERGYRNVSEFIESELNGFLTGYHKDRQLDQPRHIVVVAEKNTLMQIIRPARREYYVPLFFARGYGTIPVWRDIAKGFRQSGKEAMTLIVASDYDPEGLDLADDAVRSLRDLWDVPVEHHRVSVTRPQIDELELHSDFNPAKETSSRLKSFIERTGSEIAYIKKLKSEILQVLGVRLLLLDRLFVDVHVHIRLNGSTCLFCQVVRGQCFQLPCFFAAGQLGRQTAVGLPSHLLTRKRFRNRKDK